MFVAGLTGGIGSGKTTFASLLAERGAQIIDADALGRNALRPDQPTWHSVVGQFGDAILQANSLDIDRKHLAAIVFSEPNKLAALNAELGLEASLDALIAVTAANRVRKERLQRARDMDPLDIEARMKAQMDPEEVAARADIVVHNDGTFEDLVTEADRVWAELEELRDSKQSS